MAYGVAGAYRSGNRLTIQIELPDRGEVSKSGRSENLVDPQESIVVSSGSEPIRITLAVVRSLRSVGRQRAASPKLEDSDVAGE